MSNNPNEAQDKENKREYMRQYRKNNPDAIREYKRRYRKKNANKLQEYQRQRYANKKESLSKQAHQYRENNPKKVHENDKRSKLKHKYGLSIEDANAMKSKGCAICGNHSGKIVIDHDHKTGIVRGALCDNCNKGLGSFKDNPDILRNAAKYLERLYRDKLHS